MSRIRGRNTKPELVLRRALHANGFRFRLHRRDLPGRPDLVFPRYRSVILVHGCFWHGHGCSLFKWPKTRRAFWESKISRNAERDRETLAALKADGWRVLVVWECALKGRRRRDLPDLLDGLEAFIRNSVESSAEIAEHGSIFTRAS